MATPLNSSFIGPTPAGGAGGTPDPHAASHENGGSDELALDGSQITTGITGTGDVVKAASPTLTGNVTVDVGAGTFKVENGATSEFEVNGATGQVGIGAAPQTDVGVLLDTPARSITANAEYDRLYVKATGAVTVTNATTSALITTARFDEPKIVTAGSGAVTAAATVYIENAPTEAASNYALWVDGGTTRLDGTLQLGGTLAHEYGGLEADVSAYSGLLKISGGATSQAVAGTDYGRYEQIHRLVSSTTRISSVRRYMTMQAPAANATLTADRLYLHPMYGDKSSLYSILFSCIVGVAATNARIGVYASGSDNLPTGTPLIESGNLSTATNTTTREYVPGSPLAWTPGALYWFAIVGSGAPQIRGVTSNAGFVYPISTVIGCDGTNDGTINPFYKGIYVAHTFGALPDLTSSNFTQVAEVPVVYYSVSA